MKKGLFVIFFLTSLFACATHNRAGEIAYRQIGINQFEITLTTYTRIETEADRPVIEIDWGDGSIDSLERLPGFPEFIATDINKHQYKSTHTFPGPGVYNVSLEDPNRNEGVVNIPNSINIPFSIQSQIIINPFLGENNSPVLLNPPIEEACVDAIFQHNPSAFDEDGDSLSFSLITALGTGSEPVAGYNFPDGVSINPNTGTLTWDRPTLEGEFNFAILIEEYRNGFLIGSMIRDMQVSVKDCNNNPPVIDPISDLCVVAGTTIDLDVFAADQDSGQAITLTATGGPLTEVSGDQASFSEVVGIDSVSGNFNWITGCSHVRSSPYQVYFKAQDNDNQVQLIDLHTLKIRVIGPKVENVTSEANLNGIQVNWTRSICEEVVGYKVYRKPDSLLWNPDSCEVGVPAYTGYEFIGSINGRDNSSFFDSTVINRNLYCYRIVACFPDGSESIASEETCAETFETKPIPTHADVIKTDSLLGSIVTRWENPKHIDSLDLSNLAFYKLYTIQNGMRTEIYRTPDLDPFNMSFNHENINTKSQQHFYIVELIDIVGGNETLISTSEEFSSVFLSGLSADRTIKLSWDYDTPWRVDSSIILNDLGLSYEFLDTVYINSVTYDTLTNSIEYCYIIGTYGQYTTDTTDSVIFLNRSQELCITPEDIIPPCVPEINSSSNCELDENSFSWTIDSLDCNQDLTQLSIYFKRNPSDDYNLLVNNISPFIDTTFIHNNISEVAGCYAFTVTDSVGNESDLSFETCFDNCPIYQLPNIFTPNGDNINDFVVPFPHKYVESIDLKIFNRWGQIVYTTKEINVNWDGVSSLTKLKCSSGVYFYTCNVNEQRLNGIETRVINGFIQLVDN